MKKELKANQDTNAGRAGITSDDMHQFWSLTERITQINKFVRPVEKLLELLLETRSSVDDELQGMISTFGASIDRRAKKAANADLVAVYEKLLAYRSAAAMKGVKTREKNAEAQAAAATGANGAPPA